MSKHALLRLSAIAVVILASASACGEDSPQRAATPTTEPSFPPRVSPYDPQIDPADFVAGIDNPYMPLEPGTTNVYEGTSEGEKEQNTVYVTHKTKEILGVTCTVVLDIVSVDGEIAEKTFDWYAQDRFGNVWYFGEASSDYENGKVAGTGGSWEAGVDGALPGIVMLGDPQLGDKYRQEFYEGEAEDFGQILELDASIEVPYGSYDDVIVTTDFTPLEPDVLENKFYAQGVGVVLERHIKGPQEESQLVDIRHD